MAGTEKGESVFDFKIGPAFIAVVISMVTSFAQFVYSQGQQNTINDNTKKVTEKLETAVAKQEDKQSNQIERLVKVETIVSTVQAAMVSIDAKLDRIAASVKLDKH